MRVATMIFVTAIGAGAAWAQTAAPAAGTGGGGGVAPSASTPRAPTGATPPGTATTDSPSGQAARDTIGQQVIGRTTTSGPIPGDTGPEGTGAAPRR